MVRFRPEAEEAQMLIITFHYDPTRYAPWSKETLQKIGKTVRSLVAPVFNCSNPEKNIDWVVLPYTEGSLVRKPFSIEIEDVEHPDQLSRPTLMRLTELKEEILD